MKPTAGHEGILAGGGELGALMRAKDWSTTPLGSVEHWPESLKTAVRIVLTSRQAMSVWWGDQMINLYNDAYKEILGGKHPSALGQPASVVFPDVWHVAEPRAQSAMLRNEGTYDEAHLLLMERNGYSEETYYTFSMSPVPTDEGVGGILIVNTDETQRIICERQVELLHTLVAGTADARTIEAACRQSAHGLETNPRDLPFALIYLVDPEHRRVVLAGQANIVAGHPAAVDIADIDVESPWPFADVMRSNEACLMSDIDASVGPLPMGAWDRPPHQVVAMPIPASGQTGLAGVLIAGLNPYRRWDANYKGFLRLVASQIAASIANAQAYEEERKRAEALAEIDRAKTAFFSNVSHEFRTPLTLLLGPIEDSLADVAHPLPLVQRERQEVAQRNALRLLRLVNSLLDFSRIEAGRMQASYRQIDLATETTDLSALFRSAIERANLTFIVDCPPLPADATVFVDRDMWEKIVLNLLSNAFKFTFEGEIAISIRLVGNRIEMTVRDTGTGIPAEELPRLFERFHRIQGARARTHEGTGIGLALVHEMVKLHGGNIRVESVFGGGTTFTVSLPTGSAHLPANRIAADQSRISTTFGARPFVDEALGWLPDRSASEDAHGSMSSVHQIPNTPMEDVTRARVLLADDNRDMREYVARLLQDRYIVETVADGQAALDAVRRTVPDLILSDVMMPHLDGFGLIAALRADPRTREIPIIILSARAGEEAKVVGLQGGADDYLVKPFSAQELLARVGTRIELTRVRKNATDRERVARLHAEELAEVRDQALASTRIAHHRLHDAFMQAPAVVCVLRGPNHIFEMANARYLQMVEQRPIIGKPVREVFSEAEAQGFFELLDRVYATGEPFIGKEMPLLYDRKRQGIIEEVILDLVYHPLRDAEGHIEGIFVHAVEVTEQVHARRLLVASEQRFRSLAAFSPIGIFLTNTEGRFEYTNPSLQWICGFSAEEALGEGWVRLLHPDDRASVSHAWHAAVATGQDWDEEMRFVHADGRVRWTHSHSAPVRSDDHRVLGFVGIVEDVTGRIRAEADAQLRTRQAELRAEVGVILTANEELQTQLQLCAEAITRHVDAAFARIWTLNESQQVLELQASAGKYTHLDGPHSRIPVGSLKIGGIGAERKAHFTNDVLNDPNVNDKEWARREGMVAFAGYPLIVGDRLMGVMSMFASSALSPDTLEVLGSVASTIALGIERHRSEAQRLRVERQKEEFLAAAAHDLKTPLTSIQGLVQLLQRQLAREDIRSERTSQTLLSVSTATKRATSMINELLDLSRLGTINALELQCTKVDLVEVAEQVIAEQQLTTRQHRLRLDAATPRIYGIWDAERLDRAISNLVGNAIKYTPNGGEINVKIVGVTVGDEPWATISVQDTGIGIPFGELERIFDRFHRAENANRIPGSGIGLNYVHEIITRHGGRIAATSEQGHGTTVTVHLPCGDLNNNNASSSA